MKKSAFSKALVTILATCLILAAMVFMIIYHDVAVLVIGCIVLIALSTMGLVVYTADEDTQV